MAHKTKNTDWIINPNTNRMVKVGSKTYKILMNANAIESNQAKDNHNFSDDDESAMTDISSLSSESSRSTQKFKANKTSPDKLTTPFNELIKDGGIMDIVDKMNDKELEEFFEYINKFELKKKAK